MFFNKNKKNIERLKADIERLSAEAEKLAGQNNIIRAMLGSMAEGVIAVDRETKIISVNPSAENIFNIRKAESEGRLFLEIVRNNDIEDIINDVLRRRAFISRELTLVWPMRKVFQVNASPLFEKDKTSGCFLVIHDITEMRRLEMMRRDFVANVSHEIRTPLTSIKGFVETLLEGAIDDKENNRKFLEIIQDQAERLNNLVNDLLSLSRLESQEAVLAKKSFDLRQAVEDVVLSFRSQAKKNGIEIKDEVPAKILVNADKDRIGQVFTNLIDNAIKFNKAKGSVKIYVRESEESIKITIEDSGSGIPARDIARVFERFYRVDKARSRELGGTGLGLSIVKHIVELHGGDIGVESAEGHGSKFWFIIPKS